MATKAIRIYIEASGRYCSNDCPFMSNDAKRCELFDVELSWKTGKATNGNIRPRQCRASEILESQPATVDGQP